MKFSVIMPSRLVPYPNQADNIEQKFMRAVRSVLDQSFEDFELIIIADGCERTKELVSENFNNKKINLLTIKHQGLFSNAPRNEGIRNAKGEYITYCDIDDCWGENHLEIIDKNISDLDWCWYNDIVYDKKTGQWIERPCNVRQIGHCGTSTICHANRLGLLWQRPGYSHDFHFIRQLLNHKNHRKIETPEYYVCHIPRNYDL